MSALRAARLTVRYPGQAHACAALSEIDLTVEPGQRLLLLGPNGAGKSTLLRTFAGLTRPTTGHVEVFDAPVARARLAVGVIGHTTFLYDELTALENLLLYANLYGVAAPRPRAQHLLERVGLADVADHRVGLLSRGQQQRLALARAVIHEPRVLLLDEPDTGLDLAALDTLDALTREDGRTVLLTTHNITHGVRLANEAAVLAHGHIVHRQDSLDAMDTPQLTSLLDRLARA